MNTFCFNLTLPISKKNVRIRELKNIDFKNILKFIQNNDNQNLSVYLDYLLSIYTDLDFVPTNIDKFCIFLMLRSVSIGNVIELHTTKDGKKAPIIKILINSIIDNLEKNLSGNYEQILEKNDIKVIIDLPKSLYINKIENIFQDIIKEIYISEDAIGYWELDKVEREEIINNLDSYFSKEIYKHIGKIGNDLKHILLFENKWNVDELNDIVLNPFCDILLEFLKNLYNRNLLNYFEIGYVLCKHARISLEYFDNMIPIETEIYISQMKKEAKEAEDREKHSREPGRQSVNVHPLNNQI